MGQKDGEKFCPSLGLFWSLGMCSLVSQPAVGLGGLRTNLLLLWKLQSTLFLPHAVVCLAPQCLYLQGLYHCALGAAVISTDYWEPAPLLNPEGIILEGPLIGWTSPQGIVQSPYLGWSLDGHPSTVRKLFLAESCFELLVIIFLAISDPDKYWPGHRNVWVKRQIREFGVAFE